MKIRGQVQRGAEILRVQELVKLLSADKEKHPKLEILFNKACARLRKLFRIHNRKETRCKLIRDQE